MRSSVKGPIIHGMQHGVLAERGAQVSRGGDRIFRGTRQGPTIGVTVTRSPVIESIYSTARQVRGCNRMWLIPPARHHLLT